VALVDATTGEAEESPVVSPQKPGEGACAGVERVHFPGELPRRSDKPSRTHWLTAREVVQATDVTLVVQLDMARASKLLALAAQWTGPISAAVFIEAPASDALASLLRLYMSSVDLQSRVDVHLCFDDERMPRPGLQSGQRYYPHNTLRNLAVSAVRSDWVLYVEGDFEIPTGTYRLLQRHVHESFEPNKAHTMGYILPLWSGSHAVAEKSHLVKEGLRPMPYESHDYMDYRAWLVLPNSALPTALVLKAKDGFGDPPLTLFSEPYFVVSKELVLQYDQNVFCNGDKVSQVFAMGQTGFAFSVLPDVFLVNVETGDKGGGNSSAARPRLENVCAEVSGV
jgi:hypothetical protein